jgi:signal transduction histidine kinase
MYPLLSKLPFPRSYVGKFLLVSFIGIHIPLIGIVVYILISADFNLENKLPILIAGTIATLCGTAITLWIQFQLLSPIRRSIEALREFRDHQTIPELPVHFQDEAGELMRNTQLTLSEQAELIRHKRDLLSVLSHDIRVHVSGALMIAEDIRQLDDLDEIRELASYLKQSAQKQMTLMNNIMAYTEVSSGWVEANRSYQILGVILDDLTMNMKPHAVSKGIQFDVTSDLPLDHTLHIDIPKTEQILNNLMHNAIKFTDPGGSVCVHVKAEGDRVRFDVTDTGVGMSQKDIRSLFGSVRPESRRGTKNEKGTGIGIWICRRFAEAQGGTLSATSTEGKGSTFSLVL